ncbi:MAG: ABC transporter ATP-binding protein, partial [Saprospiraceae bacterium]|nr:ABC transporter ATP-binding protein [Saprospiraceae bacterium]
LKGVNLAFEKPGIYAVLGPNGSGKTTIIKSIMGMVHPEAGLLKVYGRSLQRSDSEYRRRISYVPQIARFPENLTVFELITMIENLRGEPERRQEMLELFELEEVLHKKFRYLSGGTKQRVNLLVALMYDNPILILDEPTSGLDPIARLGLKGFLKSEQARGKIIIISSHILSFVDEMADQIVFLLEGKIYYMGALGLLKKSYGTGNLEQAIAQILKGVPMVSGNGQSKVQMEKGAAKSSSNG